MSLEANALGFLAFYLSPFSSRKSIDLLKLQLLKRSRKVKTKDPLLAEAGLIREIVRVLVKRRKAILAHLNPLEPHEPAFLELIKLPPEDALLLCSGAIYPISLDALSLALKTPRESLLYRKERLVALFESQKLHLEALQTDPGAPGTQSLKGGIRPRNRGLFTRFQTLPILIRFSIETSLVLGILLGLLWVVPEIRNRYEASIEKKINEYLVESALTDAPPPEGTSSLPREPITEGVPEEDAPVNDVVKSSSEPPSAKRQPRVNEGETWRFSFTGAATPEIESMILDSLKRIGVAGAKPLSVPGGIQFDFNLETAAVLDLKSRFETAIASLQRKAPGAQATPLAYANMSWYKKKHMGTRKIPAGNVQVIVWISTL